jgi:hypothetical protein
VIKKLKLGGVDSESLRAATKEDRAAASAFLVENVLGKDVILRVIRRGDYFYARISTSTLPSVTDTMFEKGLLTAFKKPEL